MMSSMYQTHITSFTCVNSIKFDDRDDELGLLSWFLWTFGSPQGFPLPLVLS